MPPSSTRFQTWPEKGLSDGHPPIRIEIGPGRGDFLLSLAASHPRSQVVGIEYKHKRFLKMIPRIERLCLRNIILIEGRGEEVIPEVFKPGSVSRFYINFPDPWPKRRHARRRMIRGEFLRLLSGCLKLGGMIQIVTDHPSYYESIERLLKEGGYRFRSRVLSPKDPLYPGYAPSLYELKKREAGLPLYWLGIRKA